MENFYLIYQCVENKFRVFLNLSNSDLTKKFTEINRDKKTIHKFVLVIEAIKVNSENKTQYNLEADCNNGKIYAIKVDQHRFYTLQTTNNGYRELYISRYGKKESQENTKKLTATIETIKIIQIQKILS
ncbi:MAG: hypothetical protein QM541_08985 [Flavobacterium sp.]|nr:hypothetical protein [Flavobacterium sp.]